MPDEPVDFRMRTITGLAADGPTMLVIAGVHGDELEPTAAVRKLLTMIDPSRLRGRMNLIPVVNEPAYRRDARVAEDGLDLARTCPGDASGSITRRIAARLSREIGSCDFFIDLHTGGRALRLCALTGYMLHADVGVLDTQRRMARAFGLPVIWGTSPVLQGRSLSVARDAGVPAIYCEFGGGGGFEEHGGEAYVAGCLRTLCELNMYDGLTPAPPPRVWVEDPRDRSGVLQAQHPAPVGGFFEPAVELEQEVKRGQTIGRIVDPVGEALAEIPAVEAGVVVMLRAWRRVDAGDALAALASGIRLRGE